MSSLVKWMNYSLNVSNDYFFLYYKLWKILNPEISDCSKHCTRELDPPFAKMFVRLHAIPVMIVPQGGADKSTQINLYCYNKNSIKKFEVQNNRSSAKQNQGSSVLHVNNVGITPKIWQSEYCPLSYTWLESFPSFVLIPLKEFE